MTAADRKRICQHYRMANDDDISPEARDWHWFMYLKLMSGRGGCLAMPGRTTK